MATHGPDLEISWQRQEKVVRALGLEASVSSTQNLVPQNCTWISGTYAALGISRSLTTLAVQNTLELGTKGSARLVSVFVHRQSADMSQPPSAPVHIRKRPVAARSLSRFSALALQEGYPRGEVLCHLQCCRCPAAKTNRGDRANRNPGVRVGPLKALGPSSGIGSGAALVCRRLGNAFPHFSTSARLFYFCLLDASARGGETLTTPAHPHRRIPTRARESSDDVLATLSSRTSEFTPASGHNLHKASKTRDDLRGETLGTVHRMLPSRDLYAYGYPRVWAGRCARTRWVKVGEKEPLASNA